MRWPDPPSARHPHRRLEPASSRPRCEHCNGVDWTDLASVGSARALRDVETFEHLTTRRGIRRMGLATIACAFAVPLVAGAGSFAKLGVWAALTAAAIGYDTSVGRLLQARPFRWSLPPAPRRGSRSARGRVEGAETLRAPLSGTPCLGYELAVRPRRGFLQPTPRWSLLEQNVAAFRVGTIEIGSCRLDLKRRRLPPAAFTADAPRALVARGLTLHDDPEVYESLLLPGDDAIAWGERDGAMLVQARRRRRRGPTDSAPHRRDRAP